jgi:hypothetical protein
VAARNDGPKEKAMTAQEVTLVAAQPDDYLAFKRDLQAAFALAATEELDEPLEGPIPDDADLDKSMNAPCAIVLHVVADGHRVGGAVVAIDPATQSNRLDLFFIAVGKHGQGLGRLAWFAIEAMFPGTLSWETATPCFEKRNIHFYVNVCGFHIVEFFNDRHRDPHMLGPANLPGDGDMFRFVKMMQLPR